MGQSMVGRLAIKAGQLQPGGAFAAAVPAGGLVEIVDLDGRQVAELVAFDQADPSERLSLGVTRQESKNIMLSLGMKVFSSRRRPMLDLVEDTVGRHDLLWTGATGFVPERANGSAVEGDSPVVDGDSPVTGLAGDPVDVSPLAVATESTGGGSTADELSSEADDSDSTSDGSAELVVSDDERSEGVPEGDAGKQDDMTEADHVSSRPKELTGFAAALEPFGLSTPDAPDPINFFMQVAVMQRGDLELRAPLSQRGDRVVLKALTDLIVAVRCSAAMDETNGESPSDILVRVYR